MGSIEHFEIPADDVMLHTGSDKGVGGDIQQLTETSRWVYFNDSEGNIVGAYDTTE